MIALNYPNFNIRLRNNGIRTEVFDAVRKKWLVCTPEEWVRQHLLQWLMFEKQYPASNIAIEAGLKVNHLPRRSDVLAYKNGKPFLLAECKAPEIKITQKVFDQVFRYNLEIKAEYLLVTNGLTHFYAHFSLEKNEVTHLEMLPSYSL